MKNKLNKNYILVFLLLLSVYSFGQNKSTNEITNNVIDIKKKMQSQKYKLEFEKKGDLNKDGIIDKILVFNGDINAGTDIETIDSPIFIILSNMNKVIKNNKILYTFIPSNSNLDNNLVVKDNYFTVEQITGGGNNKQIRYITFKFTSNRFVLHKYGITSTYLKNNKMIEETKVYTIKNFGVISFEDFNIDTINELIH